MNRFSLIFAITLISFGWFSPLFAQTLGRSDEDILQRGASSVWADLQNNDVQSGTNPIDRDNLPNRNSWTESNSSYDFWSWWYSGKNANGTGKKTSGGTNSGNSSWEVLWKFFGYVGYLVPYVFWSLLLLGGVGATAWIIRNQEVKWYLRSNRSTGMTEDIALQQAKYSDLPVDLEQNLAGLKSQADAYRNKGDYSKAIVYLFVYMLVELDAAQLIYLSRGKTNYQYLKELRNFPSIRGKLRHVISLFEDSYFGGKVITKERFDAVWGDLSAFEAELRNPSGSNDSHLASKHSEDEFVGGRM